MCRELDGKPQQDRRRDGSLAMDCVNKKQPKSRRNLARWGAVVLLACLGLLAARVSALGATTIYVDVNATGLADGTSWTNAFTTLQDGLAAAASGDQIWVAAGVYYPDEGSAASDDDRTESFALIEGVEVYGGFAGSESSLVQRDPDVNVTVLSGDIDQNDTIDADGVVTDVADISGDNAYHVVNNTYLGSSGTLDGFVITAGDANGSSPNDRAGGIYNSSGSAPTLRNLTVRANRATYGAGMYGFSSGQASLEDVVFQSNYALAQGGGTLLGASDVMMIRVTYLDNQSGSDGGGVYSVGSSPSFADVTFSENQALGGDGGGMSITSSSSPTLERVVFEGNQASDCGGAVYLNGGAAILTNVLFIGNYAGNDGGGMRSFGGTETLTNVTFTGNYAVDTGGGLILSNTNPTFTNAILWNNGAGNWGGQIANFSGTGTFSYSDIQDSGGSGAGWDTFLGIDGGNNIDSDPDFLNPVDPVSAPTKNGDVHLEPTSPAIDAGDGSACPAEDLSRNPRPMGLGCDMGVYELTLLYLPLIMR